MRAKAIPWTVTAFLLIGGLVVSGCTMEKTTETHAVTNIDRTVTHYPDGSSSSSMRSTTQEP